MPGFHPRVTYVMLHTYAILMYTSKILSISQIWTVRIGSDPIFDVCAVRNTALLLVRCR